MTSCRQGLRILLVCALLAGGAAFGQVETLNLLPWTGCDAELPRGWSQQGVDKRRDVNHPFYGAAYFNGQKDVIRSPVFSSPIVSVTVEVGVNESAATRRPVVVPIIGGVDGKENEIAISKVGEYVRQTVSFAGLGACQLKVLSSAGIKNWDVRKIIVVYGRDEPIDPPGPVWQLTEFLPRPGEKTVDFSDLWGIGKQTAWTNGTDGDRVYAFANDDPVAVIRPATDGSYIGGLYCFDYGQAGVTNRALALLASGTTDVKLLLPIRIDVPRSLEELSVSFVARRVKAGEGETTLSFAWAALDGTTAPNDAAVVWHEVADQAYVAADEPGSRTAPIPVSQLNGAARVCFRWRVPAQTRSAMVGVADVCVRGRLLRSGMQILVR